LLVGENEENCFCELGFIQHAVQLLAGILHTLLVVGVNHENEALCVLVVVPPKGTDL